MDIRRSRRDDSHCDIRSRCAGAGDVFDYLAQIDNLPDWATEFARDLRWDEAGACVVNGLGGFASALTRTGAAE